MPKDRYRKAKEFMELANCFSIPILSPFVHFSISQRRIGMMERCREMMGLLQPA